MTFVRYISPPPGIKGQMATILKNLARRPTAGDFSGRNQYVRRRVQRAEGENGVLGPFFILISFDSAWILAVTVM